MPESMIVEAIRSAQMRGTDMAQGAMVAQSVADPAAVAQFQAAMAANGPTQVSGVPFAEAVSKTWMQAHENNQGILHRIRALSELSAQNALSSAELLELQYEVANLAFQQEIVTKVAEKTSTAVQTLIKNQ